MKHLILLTLASGTLLVRASEPKMPMPPGFSESATYRWLQKKVLAGKPVDDAESLTNWKTTGEAEMSLSSERSRDGSHSVRLKFQTRRPQDVSPASKRNYGTAGVMRVIPGEDWSAFNRVSLWVYPDYPGWRVAILRVFLHNEGKVKVPGGFYPVYHCWVLKNHAWNHVVWEFPDVPRDKVTGVEIQCRRQGHEPEAGNELTLDIDQLALERVDADKYEGWDVWPGRIAFSHTGYRPSSSKVAIASGLQAPRFSLIDQETGQTVLTRPVQNVKTRHGDFQKLDFSGFTSGGAYAIRAGDVQTRGFRIADRVWDTTIWKTINFFFAERCGFDIPGSHRICHRDWQGVHGDKKIIINGGWHDAGDLSQGLVNTSEAVYSMFDLATQLRRRDGESPLTRRLIEEAKWGLDWVLKTSFGDGNRIVWATMGMWTDGILGNNDDVTADAQNGPYENFLASASEGIAARVLRDTDPELAAFSLRKAHEDWQFAVDGFDQKRVRGTMVEAASAGVLASLELLKATGKQEYGKKALDLAAVVLDSQQREVAPELKAPITGYFYRGPDKQALLHFLHRSHEQAPAVALARLCDAFPGHADWIKWYSAVTLHSEFFQKAMAQYTEPFRMLPNSLHRDDEYQKAPEALRDAYRQQVLNGIPVGGPFYVRVYPVQPQGTFRGNYGTLLSQTKAISAAALLRGNKELELLAEEQLQWIVGRNPFAQSTLYGEGYDYGPQYSAMSGDLTGSLPVGIMSRENFDLPYWPVHNHPNYREVWVHPVSRWMWVLADLAAPATPPVVALAQKTSRDGQVTIRARAKTGKLTLLTENLALDGPAEQTVPASGELVWRAKMRSANAPWVAVAIQDGNYSTRGEVFGWVQ